MRISWRTEWSLWLVLLGMFVMAGVSWSSAPDQIPVHWGLNGEVDRYGGKVEGVLMLPLVALGVYLLLTFLPRLDPGRANYAQFATAYAVIRLGILLVLAVIYGAMLLSMRGRRVDMAAVVPLAIGALFLALGGVMGKIRPNWFVGIRTPWTLSSKRSWVRTHRVAGWVFLAMGLGMAVSGFTRATAAFVATVVIGAAGMLGAVIYSYVVWRGDPDRVPPAGTLPAE